MSKAFQDNGCYKPGLVGEHDTIDLAIRKLYNDLTSQGYELNEILAMLTLAVCDIRTDIALDQRDAEVAGAQ